MNQVKLLSKKSKKIEREIVTLYTTVGRIMDLNPKMTEIFAYLKIYDSLTQKQLEQLTGFSLGTISTTLQLFLQTDIISRQIIPGTHTNLYRIKRENVEFVYTPSSRIIEDHEKLDTYVVEQQEELEKIRHKYPSEVQFLHKRLNSIRNYVEVQRRQINRKQKYSFFEEGVSEILPLDKMIVYPFEINEIEETIMDIFGYYRNDPIRNRILSIFYTHRSIDQQTLMNQSGYSRSTVSRFLRQSLKKEFLQSLPKAHRKPRIYYLESISLSTTTYIMNTDNFIFSTVPRFQEILSSLQSVSMSKTEETAFLIGKLQELIDEIQDFKNETRFFRKAHQELSTFLKH
jgi:DNA-binding transcriptional regulator GbsR (MarR family)